MTASETPRALRVLVADDDPSLRLALTMILERRGHAVVAAADTDAARAHLDTDHPDVALVDAGMPRNGVAFWRECDEGGRIPAGALLLTGDVGALGELAHHPRVLEKPFDFPGLVERVERMVRESGS